MMKICDRCGVTMVLASIMTTKEEINKSYICNNCRYSEVETETLCPACGKFKEGGNEVNAEDEDKD